jgi:hypothetical protein
LATIPFNLVFGLLAGLGLCACARTQLQSGTPPWQSDLLLPVVSFAVLTTTPVSLYLYLAYPDWSWMYLLEPARLPRATGLAVVVTITLMVPVGYLLGWASLRLFQARGLFGLLGGLAMGLALIVIAGQRRFFYLGRYEDFRAAALNDIALPLRPLTQGKLFYALLCIVPVVLCSFIVVARHLWAQGRWLRQQGQGQASIRTGEHAVSSGQGGATSSPRVRAGASAQRSSPGPGTYTGTGHTGTKKPGPA